MFAVLRDKSCNKGVISLQQFHLVELNANRFVSIATRSGLPCLTPEVVSPEYAGVQSGVP